MNKTLVTPRPSGPPRGARTVTGRPQLQLAKDLYLQLYGDNECDGGYLYSTTFVGNCAAATNDDTIKQWPNAPSAKQKTPPTSGW
jgi:hypothetical protein